MTKEEKQKQINNLTVAALDLCVKAAKVAIKPRSKYKRTNNRRMVKIMTISFQIAAIRNQIFTVRAIPRFKSGGFIRNGDEILIKKHLS